MQDIENAIQTTCSRINQLRAEIQKQQAPVYRSRSTPDKYALKSYWDKLEKERRLNADLLLLMDKLVRQKDELAQQKKDNLEEDAEKKYGAKNIEVYHRVFAPLEWTMPNHRPENMCYAKLICDKNDNERVVGFHYCGPNAGEVTQGWSLAMKCGATYDDFWNTVGIHPTVAEEFTILSVTKASGESAEGGSC